MSHHTDENPFKGYSKPANFMDMPNNLGATGKFPDGKISENDEGEIRMGVTNDNGTVIVDFGKPVHSLGLTPEQAISLGETLIKRAKA